jgi:t-SNARE complex subunit (syntaxin)
MPGDIRSEAAKERIIVLGIVVVLIIVAVLGVLTFVGMEFLDSALR